MARYEVELTETVYHDPVTIDAESENNAEKKARDLWENGKMTTGESDLRFNVEVVDNGEHLQY